MEVPTNFEFEIIHKNGKVIPVEANSASIEYAGKPADVVFLRDITERKQAEEGIRTAQEKYKKVVESFGEGLFVTDMNGFLTYVNKEAERISGRSEEDLIRKHFSAIVPKKEYGAIPPMLKKLLKGENVHNVEIQIMQKDGKLIFVELTLTPNIKDGKLIEMIGVIRDITERKRAEEEIKAAEEKFKNVVETIGDGLFVTGGRNGLIKYINPEAEKISGYNAEELAGKSFTSIYSLINSRLPSSFNFSLASVLINSSKYSIASGNLCSTRKMSASRSNTSGIRSDLRISVMILMDILFSSIS